MKNQISIFDSVEKNTSQEIVNIATVPQRSPFRYPGGKTWLIPTVRKWLKQEKKSVSELIEPFAGGGIVSLTAAFEKLATEITMVELDEEIAAVWKTIFSDKNKWLANRILFFNLNIENIKAEFAKSDKLTEEIAFCTILKNRIFHGGILAKGSGMIKNGENGKGLASRWYPKTLHDRIVAIDFIQKKLNFIEGDAFKVLEDKAKDINAYFFIDPPYTIAGKRLYTHYDINHERLFEITAQLRGKYMLTYDDTPEIRDLAKKYGLKYKTIPMKTTLHYEKNEIIISDDFSWW